MATKSTVSKTSNRSKAKVSKKTKSRKAKSSKASKAKGTVKKKTRRDLSKCTGLQGRFFSKIKQEYHDIDYADKLSAKDADWMGRFMEEYLGARVNHEGPKVHKKLHTKKGRKKLFDPNNARNRDIYSQMRAQGRLHQGNTDVIIEDIQRQYMEAQDIENRLIDAIDLAREISDDLGDTVDDGDKTA